MLPREKGNVEVSQLTGGIFSLVLVLLKEEQYRVMQG